MPPHCLFAAGFVKTKQADSDLIADSTVGPAGLCAATLARPSCAAEPLYEGIDAVLSFPSIAIYCCSTPCVAGDELACALSTYFAPAQGW
jgi:hypothetical protein